MSFNQRDMLETWCQEHGFTVAGVYADDGYSGLYMDIRGMYLFSDVLWVNLVENTAECDKVIIFPRIHAVCHAYVALRVAIYCRLSKDDNLDGESASIHNQRDMLETWCQEHGFISFINACCPLCFPSKTVFTVISAFALVQLPVTLSIILIAIYRLY